MIFERETGRKARHNPFKNSVYESAPQSEVGRFILTFFQLAERIDARAHVRPSLLSSTLQYVLGARWARTTQKTIAERYKPFN
jgi:hypothetical protein